MQEIVDLFEHKELDFSNWKAAGFRRLKDLLRKANLPDSEHFRTKISRYSILQYYQVSRLVFNLQKGNQLRLQLTQFESLLDTGLIFSKSLSKMCKLLQEGDKDEDSCHVKWDCDIGSPIERKVWCRFHAYVAEISANIAICKAFVKLRSRWYLFPSRLQKMLPGLDSKCWRCLKERGLGAWPIFGGAALR